MNSLNLSAITIAKASKGNPVSATALVILFFIMFNQVEATIEFLIFGERFQHWLDPIFMCAFIAYAGFAVWWCALLNEQKQTKGDGNG